MTVKLAVHGVAGRMGRAVIEAARGQDVEIVGGLETPGSPALGLDLGVLDGGESLGAKVTDAPEELLARAEVVIDFTVPRATTALLAHCRAHEVAAVVGTTGLDEEAQRALDALTKVAPAVVAPNMSVGVTLFFHLAARAATLLGDEFDAEIVEMHHRHKLDAPSGTAVRLSEVVAGAKGLDPQAAVVHGRSGAVGARPPGQVGVMTLRGGDVVGDHTLVLAGAGERLELTHRAHHRGIFARGAVRAAQWVVGQPPGRYDMADVLGISRP